MPHMVLCPECRSIQKAGEPCSICKYPISERKESPLALSCEVTFSGGIRYRAVPLDKAKAILRYLDRDVFAV